MSMYLWSVTVIFLWFFCYYYVSLISYAPWSFVLPLQCIQIVLFFFLLHWYAVTSLLDTRTSTMGLSSTDTCLRYRFPGTPRPWLRGYGASSWTTVGSTAGTDICMSITYHRRGWALQDLFVCNAGSHSSHKGIFVHGWMPNHCFFCF